MAAAIKLLALSILKIAGGTERNTPDNDLVYCFRAWTSKSRSTQDESDSLVAGDPTWLLKSDDDVVRHFAEFHSDELNTKDTAEISGTTDVIRALKKLAIDWQRDSFKTRDADQMFLTVIQSSEYYLGKQLLHAASRDPIKHQLSRETRERLASAKHQHLHDSELVFVHRVPAGQIRQRLTFRDLVDRGIRSALPELFEEVRNCPGPKTIRQQISQNSGWDPEKTAKRYWTIYNIITQSGSSKSRQSLEMAYELCMADLHIDDAVREAFDELLFDDRSNLEPGIHVGFAEE